MKLKTLLNRTNCDNEIEYFDYCINLFFYGKFQDCRDLFSAMKVNDRFTLIEYIKGCYNYSTPVETFYFNLIELPYASYF